MKINGTELTEQHKNQPVTYIPMHAKGDTGHPDCERGRIKSWNDTNVFVWYHSGDTAAATNPDDLMLG
jgi:hypothetical protein